VLTADGKIAAVQMPRPIRPERSINARAGSQKTAATLYRSAFCVCLSKKWVKYFMNSGTVHQQSTASSASTTPVMSACLRLVILRTCTTPLLGSV
jgi:hypothetical protein